MGVIFFLVCLSHITVADDSIKIFGYVKDLSNSPVKAYVGIHDENWNSIQGVETDTSGYYEISVPRHSAYNFWIDFWVQNGDYRVEAYIPQTKTVVTQPNNEDTLDLNFTLKPAGSIIVRFYNDNGSLLRNTSFRNLVLGNNWVTTLDGLPTDGVLNIAFDKECGGNWQNALPAFIVSLNESITIHIPYEVPGFGKVIVTADNEGEGHRIDQQSGFIEINLNYEIAKSKLSAVEKDYNEIISQGHDIPSFIYDQIQSAKAYLQEAERCLSGTSPDMKKVIDSLNNSLKEAFYAHEKLYLEKAQADIEKYRKGSIKIKVVNNKGEPISGCKIRYRQVSHDFLFGVGMTSPSEPYPLSLFEQLKGAGINAALPWMSWGHIEPSPGQFNWNFVDHTFYPTQLASMEYSLIAHCFLWFYDDYGNIPDYLRDIDFPLLKDMTYRHVYETVRHYSDIIKWWTISEPIMSNTLGLSEAEWLDLSKVFIQAVTEADPEAKVEIVLYPTKMDDRGYDPEEVIERFIEAGVNFDIIGIELYPFGLPLDGNGYPDLEYFASYLDAFSRFGKPIFLHEVGVPNTPSLEAQAQFLHDLYCLAFAKPYISGIVWYFITDSSFLPGAGLFEDDFTPRPAYRKLTDLISSWTSSGEIVSDADRQSTFEGFAGDYDIEVEFPEGVRTYSAHLYEQKSVSYRISPSSIIVETIPDIKANGSDGPVTLDQLDTLTVTVALDNNGITDNADWWLAADTPFGLFFFTFDGWTDAWMPGYQGPLSYLDSFEVLNMPVSGLPAGTYTLYFGVDTVMDGDVTWDSVYYDTVEVNVID